MLANHRKELGYDEGENLNLIFKEELGVIDNVTHGYEDHYGPAIRVHVKLISGQFFNIIPVNRIQEFLKQMKAINYAMLIGMVVVVSNDGGSYRIRRQFDIVDR